MVATEAELSVKLKSGKIFGLAGLWRSVKIEEKPVTSAAIITTEPNGLVGSIHNRMPVILSEKELKIWLNPGVKEFSLLHSLLDPYPAKEMEMYPVSTLVNNGRNDTPACIEPVV